MTKRFRIILCLLALCFSTVLLSACSFFASDTRAITSITSSRDEEKHGTYIIIEYDDDSEPDRFFIPDGESGEKGYGIARVDSKLQADGTTTLYIYYEDAQMPADVVNIPPVVGISGIDFTTDPVTGKVSLTITLTTGETVTQELVSGKPGINGDKIIDIKLRMTEDENGNEVVYRDEQGRMYFEIYYRTFNEDGSYTDQTEPFYVPAPVVGVDHIDVDAGEYTDSEITVTVYYTDGRKSDEYKIKKQNSWTVNESWPASDYGNDGDFYFCTGENAIFYKKGGRWSKIVTFDADKVKEVHTVKFFTGTNWLSPIKIGHGESVLSSSKDSSVILQNVSRDGYEFLGWFADDEYVNPDDENFTGYDPNVGQFTNLTVVTCDLTLYARWRKTAQ